MYTGGSHETQSVLIETSDVLLNRIEHEYKCCDTDLIINGCF